MRFLFGLIVGAALTIGGAYIHDHSGEAATMTQMRLVNWDIASARAADVRRSIANATSWLRDGWNKHVAG